MAKRRADGEIDLTDLPGETHLSEIDDSVVGGTTDEDDGEQRTVTWPDALPREEFTDLQAEVVKHLCLNPDASNAEIADAVDCSKSYPRKVKRKAAAFADPSDVSFDLIDEGGDVASTKPDPQIDAREVIKRIDAGESKEAIAEDLGVSINAVAGSLASRGKYSGSDGDDEGGDAEPANDTGQQHIQTRVPDDLADRIDAHQEREGYMNTSETARALLRAGLDAGRSESVDDTDATEGQRRRERHHTESDDGLVRYMVAVGVGLLAAFRIWKLVRGTVVMAYDV